MIKILLFVSLFLALVHSECPNCPPMECCVDNGSNLSDDERFTCEPLQEEGEQCFFNYTSAGGSYFAWCPCEEGLYCTRQQRCAKP